MSGHPEHLGVEISVRLSDEKTEAKISCKCGACELTLADGKSTVSFLCGCEDCRQALQWGFINGGVKPDPLPRLYYMRSDIIGVKGRNKMIVVKLRWRLAPGTPAARRWTSSTKNSTSTERSQLSWIYCRSGGVIDEDPCRPREMPGPQPLQGGRARAICARSFWQRERRGRRSRASGIRGEGTACRGQLPRAGDRDRRGLKREGAMTPRKPVTDWTTDWDHLDPRWREDPYPIWDELRRSCPIADPLRGRARHRQ